MIQILNPNSPKKVYSFYADTFYSLAVQFIWNQKKDEITGATFHLLDSQYKHDIIKLVVCQREPSHKYRLEAHLDYKGRTPRYVKKSHTVTGLNLNSKDTIQLAVVIYKPGEKYNAAYECRTYGRHIPDVTKGGVVIKP